MNHPASRSILHLSVGGLLERLGSSDPAPGGGAAAAMAGALGASLVQMTANLTIGRPRWVEVEERARAIEARPASLRQHLAELGDADSGAYEAVRAAYALSRQDDAQKTTRTQAIQTALQAAARVPLETARACADVLDVAEEAAPLLNAAVISDVVVGAMLARAGLDAAAVNVEINLASMTDSAVVANLVVELQQVCSGSAERLQRVVSAGSSRFPQPARQ